MNYTLISILIICSIIAIIEFTEILTNCFLKNKKEQRIITILPIRGRMEDVEYSIRQLLWKNKWINDSNFKYLILLDLGADDETASICNSICKDNLFIKFYNSQELQNFLESFN